MQLQQTYQNKWSSMRQQLAADTKQPWSQTKNSKTPRQTTLHQASHQHKPPAHSCSCVQQRHST
jgi:hypothetical protein